MIIKEDPELSRVKLSRRVCEEFNWRSSNGRLKEMSCRLALLELERTGQVVLPEPGPKLLVRASHNRLLADEQSKLLEYVAGQALSGKQVVTVPRKRNQRAREAMLEIRYAEVR